jgi:hypothetical protein
MTQSYLGAYWGPRAQSVDECANLVTELITRVAGIDPLLTDWRSGANSKRKAMDQPVVTSANPPVKDVSQVRRAMGYQLAHSEAEQEAQPSTASAGQPVPAASDDPTAVHSRATHVKAPPTPPRQDGTERAHGGS